MCNFGKVLKILGSVAFLFFYSLSSMDFHVCHYADEGSAFDALQTLADLSLMMPETTSEIGKLYCSVSFSFGLRVEI